MSSTPPTGGRLSQTEREGYRLSTASQPPPAPSTLPAPPDVCSPASRRIVLALYSGDGIARAWRDSRALVEAVDCAVMLHTTPGDGSEAAAMEVCTLGLPLWYGVGIDGWARDLRSGARSRRQIAARAVELAKRSQDHGAELVMWNYEAAWKVTPGSGDTDARIEGALAEAVEAVAAEVPGIAQGGTSFDHPRYHRLRWVETFGPRSPLVVAAHQVYGSLGAGQPLASRASLTRRVEAMTAQWAAEVRAGQVDPRYAPGGACYRPYLQLHGVSLGATVGYATEQRGVCLWAAPTRIDAEGERALRTLARLDALGVWGDGAIARWQASQGLQADGIVGRDTLRALGL